MASPTKANLRGRFFLRSERLVGLLLAMLVACSGGNQQAISEQSNVLKIEVDRQNPAADDDNSGTAARPLKSITAAINEARQFNRQGQNVHILIHPGTYREALEISGGADSSNASLTLEASMAGQVVVTGSEIWTDWEEHAEGYFSRHWPYQWGLVDQIWEPDASMSEIVRRREMVFYNGTRLRQVLSLEAMESGDFYVSEDKQRLYLDGGDNASTSRVEIAVRPELLLIDKRQNVTINGLVFQHANSVPDMGAVRINESENIRLENNIIVNNNWIGLQLSLSSDITTVANRMLHNGGTGWNAWRVEGIDSTDDEVSFNNWRGYLGGFTGWSVAGAKHLHINRGIYRSLRAIENQAAGIWLDTDNQNITIVNAVVCRNLLYGMFIEANQGPIRVETSSIMFNNNRGIFSSTSQNVSLVNNRIYDNGFEQIRLFGLPELTFKSLYATPRVTSKVENWTLEGNVISASEGQQLFSTKAWNNFLATLSSDNNIWYSHTASKSLKIGDSAYSLSEWQSVTGQDTNSAWHQQQPHNGTYCHSSQG